MKSFVPVLMAAWLCAANALAQNQITAQPPAAPKPGEGGSTNKVLELDGNGSYVELPPSVLHDPEEAKVPRQQKQMEPSGSARNPQDLRSFPARPPLSDLFQVQHFHHPLAPQPGAPRRSSPLCYCIQPVRQLAANASQSIHRDGANSTDQWARGDDCNTRDANHALPSEAGGRKVGVTRTNHFIKIRHGLI